MRAPLQNAGLIHKSPMDPSPYAAPSVSFDPLRKSKLQAHLSSFDSGEIRRSYEGARCTVAYSSGTEDDLSDSGSESNGAFGGSKGRQAKSKRPWQPQRPKAFKRELERRPQDVGRVVRHTSRQPSPGCIPQRIGAGKKAVTAHSEEDSDEDVVTVKAPVGVRQADRPMEKRDRYINIEIGEPREESVQERARKLRERQRERQRVSQLPPVQRRLYEMRELDRRIADERVRLEERKIKLEVARRTSDYENEFDLKNHAIPDVEARIQALENQKSAAELVQRGPAGEAALAYTARPRSSRARRAREVVDFRNEREWAGPRRSRTPPSPGRFPRHTRYGELRRVEREEIIIRHPPSPMLKEPRTEEEIIVRDSGQPGYLTGATASSSGTNGSRPSAWSTAMPIISSTISQDQTTSSEAQQRVLLKRLLI